MQYVDKMSLGFLLNNTHTSLMCSQRICIAVSQHFHCSFLCIVLYTVYIVMLIHIHKVHILSYGVHTCNQGWNMQHCNTQTNVMLVLVIYNFSYTLYHYMYIIINWTDTCSHAYSILLRLFIACKMIQVQRVSFVLLCRIYLVLTIPLMSITELKFLHII